MPRPDFFVRGTQPNLPRLRRDFHVQAPPLLSVRLAIVPEGRGIAAHHTTDYRVSWWFSIGWTVLVAGALVYVAYESDLTMVEVFQAERETGLAGLAAGWLSAWGAAFLSGGSVRITGERIYVRRFRDRLLRRTVEIPVDTIVEIEEVYRAMVRSHVLRVTTTDGRRIDIQHHALRRSGELKSALLELKPTQVPPSAEA